MSALEFAHWQAFWEEDLASPEDEAWRFAAQMAMAANGPLKVPNGRSAWSPADFMPKRWQPPKPPAPPPTAEQIRAQLLAMTGRARRH